MKSGFAKTASLDFFNRFIENPNIRTTGEAFIPGQNGGESPPAFFQMVGSSSLRVPQSSADLFHDSFDSPPTGSNTYNPILDGWNSCCLFAPRKYSQFAAQQPVDGQYMAMVTARYNGWMDSARSISKFVCLPANTRKLKFSWNMITNNYRQTCSTSADYFYVDVFRSGPGPNRQVYFNRYVSDSCGLFGPIPMSFDLGHRSGRPVGVQ